MKLIVGLGNPGQEYVGTRHNIGFSFVDSYVCYKFGNVNWKSGFKGLYYISNISGEKTIFLKPQTYMNLSGESVREICNYYKIDIDDILVICDDLDLNVGNFKLKANGSSGGHNGLKNIEENLGSSNFKRLRIGVSKDKNIPIVDYVLGKFSILDSDTIKSLFNELYNVIDDYYILNFGDLMSKYNRKNR